MKKIVNKVNRKLVQLYVRSQVLLMDKGGASFVEFIIYLVIVIAVGAMILAAIKLLFNENILPGATSRIDAMWS